MTSARAALLVLPLAGLALLLAAPGADVEWQHQPSHFWLVLAGAVVTALLAASTGEAARRRGDARLFLVSLSFLAAAGFLGLHALATPKVLLDAPNQGFAIATPVGLLLSAALAAASASPLPEAWAAGVMRRAALLRGIVLALLVAWGAWSLSGLAPLDAAPAESRSAPLVILAVPALALYAYAAVRYLRLDEGRGSDLVLAVVAALVLLAEAMLAVALARTWKLSWWEWHVLMLTAFGVVALAARRAPPAERFGDLYLPSTADTTRELTVLFVDLAGFTAWSEEHEPAEVSEMLDGHLEVVQEAVEGEGGDVDRVMGDAVLATFNTRGDLPDHARRGVAAALALRAGQEKLARERPDWPRLRIGVNTGRARVGVVGTSAGRTFTVLGDAVNVAARLQAAAPLGEIAVGPGTLAALPGASVRPLGPLALKGKREPVEAHVVDAL